MAKLRLLIADDQPLMRAGFRAVLEATGEMEVVAEAGDGAEAGTADSASGFFRDLVATGRSPLSLFFVRLPAAIAVSLALVLSAFALSVIATFVFAGGTPTPSLSLILRSAGWIALATVIVVAFAVGAGSRTGSRAVTLAAVIGWQLVATQLLLKTTALGSVRDALLTVSLRQVAPFDIGVGTVAMSTGVAVAVLVAWALIPAALGAWQTKVRDA